MPPLCSALNFHQDIVNRYGPTAWETEGGFVFLLSIQCPFACHSREYYAPRSYSRMTGHPRYLCRVSVCESGGVRHWTRSVPLSGGQGHRFRIMYLRQQTPRPLFTSNYLCPIETSCGYGPPSRSMPFTFCLANRRVSTRICSQICSQICSDLDLINLQNCPESGQARHAPLPQVSELTLMPLGRTSNRHHSALVWQSFVPATKINGQIRAPGYSLFICSPICTYHAATTAR